MHARCDALPLRHTVRCHFCCELFAADHHHERRLHREARERAPAVARGVGKRASVAGSISSHAQEHPHEHRQVRGGAQLALQLGAPSCRWAARTIKHLMGTSISCTVSPVAFPARLVCFGARGSLFGRHTLSPPNDPPWLTPHRTTISCHHREHRRFDKTTSDSNAGFRPRPAGDVPAVRPLRHARFGKPNEL